MAARIQPIYNSYAFTEKDPVIDELRHTVEMEGYADKLSVLATMSGVSVSTLRAWFFGKTMRPKHCTMQAVWRAMGYKSVYEKVSLREQATWEHEAARLREW